MNAFTQTKNGAGFKATAIIAIIVFALMLALSGACTGMFAFSGNGLEVMALAIGAIAIIPAALGLWAGVRAFRRGANWVSIVIYLLMILPLLFVSAFLGSDPIFQIGFSVLALILGVEAIRMIIALVKRKPEPNFPGDPFS